MISIIFQTFYMNASDILFLSAIVSGNYQIVNMPSYSVTFP